jgi:hypothetical protein
MEETKTTIKRVQKELVKPLCINTTFTSILTYFPNWREIFRIFRDENYLEIQQPTNPSKELIILYSKTLGGPSCI